MSNSKEQIQHYVGILNGRSLRERIYILLTLLVLLFVGWNQLFLEPFSKTRKKTLSEIGRVTNEVSQLHSEEAIVIQQAKTDPDQDLQQLISQLDTAINSLDLQLETKFINLLSPQKMPVLLQQLLKEQKALTLIKMENLPPEPLMTSLEVGKATPLGIYRHALNMELEGSYLKLLDYLQALEQMETQVFWDILTIDSKEFPTTKIRLQIHTLSLTEDWIGV